MTLPTRLKARPQPLLSTSFLFDVNIFFCTHNLFTYVFVYLFIHLFVVYLGTRPVADLVYPPVLCPSINNACIVFTAGTVIVSLG
jgi:hypothetical protein